MTFIELLVTVGLGALVLTVVTMLFLFGMRSFGSIGNYSAMDAQSRLALDLMSQEIRQSGQVFGAQTGGAVKWLTVGVTNANGSVTTNRFTWDSSTGDMLWEKNGTAPRTLLTGCDQWSFTFYQRSPDTNGQWHFFPTSDISLCKMINMSWRCSRTNIIRKFNTESMVTAELVMRNKQ